MASQASLLELFPVFCPVLLPYSFPITTSHVVASAMDLVLLVWNGQLTPFPMLFILCIVILLYL